MQQDLWQREQQQTRRDHYRESIIAGLGTTKNCKFSTWKGFGVQHEGYDRFHVEPRKKSHKVKNKTTTSIFFHKINYEMPLFPRSRGRHKDHGILHDCGQPDGQPTVHCVRVHVRHVLFRLRPGPDPLGRDFPDLWALRIHRSQVRISQRIRRILKAQSAAHDWYVSVLQHWVLLFNEEPWLLSLPRYPILYTVSYPAFFSSCWSTRDHILGGLPGIPT